MTVLEVARVPLPTSHGTFHAHAFECPSGFVYLALVAGDVGGGRSVLTRVHSECLTGDVLGSLRCDCGVQLQNSLRVIAGEGRGVLVYATGHEGRGIGLINKLRAYVEQDRGADTVDANVHLGFPVDSRSYAEAGEVLRALGVKSVELMTNNPAKVEGLGAAGIEVEKVRGLPVAPNRRNLIYLETKRDRLNHRAPVGTAPTPLTATPIDVSRVAGPVGATAGRPKVILKYAQTLDGRIATAAGESKWISGEAERAVAHALRAHADAVMVGVGTVMADDPQLTVRMVAGSSPTRVVLDSSLRVPLDARILDDAAPTVVVTTANADRRKREQLTELGIAVRVVRPGPGGVDVPAALRTLRGMGVESLLVEGGAAVITSLLRSRVADRLVVSIAPKLFGRGTEGIGDLGVSSVEEAVRLTNPSVHLIEQDVLIAGDAEYAPAAVTARHERGALALP